MYVHHYFSENRSGGSLDRDTLLTPLKYKLYDNTVGNNKIIVPPETSRQYKYFTIRIQLVFNTPNKMSREESNKQIDKELDLSNAGRGVWLVKVPKYIANKWEKASGTTEVGKLKISKQHGQKAQVSLTLSDAVINLDPHERIPKEHRLDVSVVTKQTLGVFSHMIRKWNATIHNNSHSKFAPKCMN